MSTQSSFKDVIDSNDPKAVEDFLNNKQSLVNVGDMSKVLQYCLEGRKNVDIFKLIFDRLKNEIKDKAISKNGNSILFLALDAGKDYFEVFKNYENINWSALDKNGNNLLHHALSLKDISEESLDFLYEKLGGNACLFKINDNSENALHSATNLKNLKWCLEKCKTTDKIKSLLHSVNNVGETPAVKLLKNKDLLSDKASFTEIISSLSQNEYDFLKTDNNEQNAISLAVQNNYDVLLESFLSDNSHIEERTEKAFSAIEHGKDNLLKSLGIKDKGDFIVKHYKELIEKCPRRFADFVANDKDTLSRYFKLAEVNGDIDDKLFSKVMHSAIECANYNIVDQCLEYLVEHISSKEFELIKASEKYDKAIAGTQFGFKELQPLLKSRQAVERQLHRLKEIENVHLDYAYQNNPEMFAKLVAKSPQLKIDAILRGNRTQESHQINQEKEISSDIANLFTSTNNPGWYDTGGILASLADLTIEESPKIFVQSGTYDQQRSLSNELKGVSEHDEDVIYIRRNPIDKEGNSSPHWVVFYFFKNEERKCNLLVVDPYGANEPSAVIEKATKGIVGNIYVSTTKIQVEGDTKSCGPISAEVARAICSQKEKLKELLRENKQIDIKEILPNNLIEDVRETGRIDYGMGFENFNCSKIRNTHAQIAQAVGKITFDTIPSQASLQRILIGEGNSLAEQTIILGRDSIKDIFNMCQDNNEDKKKVVYILADKAITDETLDEEITSLLSQDEAKVNQQQIEELDQVLGKEQFKSIREKLSDQASQLNSEQKKRIGQIREEFELNLTNNVQQKYKIDNSLLYKFLCSASVDDIGKFLDSEQITKESGDLCKAAFAAARNGDFSRLEAFINYDNDLIYQEDISGKSLLEAAAENFQSEIVQYIIHKHNEIYRNQDDKTANEVSFLGFVDNINNRKDAWARDLARELERVLRKKDFNKSDGLKIDSIFNPYTNNKEQEKEAKDLNTDNYGNLSFYADIIKSGNEEKFKAALEKIDPKYNLHSLSNSNGHNIITLTAALGEPGHWQEIEKAYSKVEGRTAISASLDNIASIGSPIQAAIIADNLSMYNHFLNAKNGFRVDRQYGIEKNNVLHTILQSNKAELLNDILFKFKGDKKSLVKALQQVNKDNKNPLDLALEKGHYGFFEKALDVVISCDKGVIRDSLIANDCGLIKSVISFGNARVIERVFDLQDKYNEKIKNKEDQLNLLNYNDRYDKENRLLKKSGLLNLACEHNNVQTANSVLKILREERNKVLSEMRNKLLDKEEVLGLLSKYGEEVIKEIIISVSVNALTASISKDSNKKEIFDFLLGQGIDFKTFNRRFTTPIHKAAECGNTYALKYFINKFPENDILNLQDEDGKTPLHLAISNGNRKAVEFLIENGADFDKSDNKGITPFELALENNRFADICIDLLKHNPKATTPLYRAISSDNEKLIEALIDQNYWILDQRNGKIALKLALGNGINRDLTAKIADKSIENFKKLNEKSQKTLLELGFLNDIVKSGIYNLHKEGSKRAGEISEFLKSQVEKDRSLLSVTNQGTTLLHDIICSNNYDLFANIKDIIGHDAITKKSGELEETALHAAVRSGNAYIVNTILKKIGDEENIKFAVNEYDAKGYTPLQTAAKLGYEEIYDLLKERGGNLKSKTKAGDSIAHLLILSAMKDRTDSGYEYQELLKGYPELTRYVNNAGSGLLATAAKCTDRDEAPKIIKQLLENEFKHKKNQLTEEDAVKLLSNAISSNNFAAVQKVVFDNMKEKIPLASKIADAIAEDGIDTKFKTRARKIIANTIAPNSQEHINNISKTKVLSQSIKEVLSDTEEKKQSLLQNALNFLHIKAQKGSSDKVGVNTLFNFLVRDQGSYTSSKDDLFLVEEEVKISSARKNIFVQQEELNRKFNTFVKQKSEYPLWQKQKESNEEEITKLKHSEYELEVSKSIINAININDSIDNIAEVVCNNYFQKNPNQNPNEYIYGDVTRKQCVIDDIKSIIAGNKHIDFALYIRDLKEAPSKKKITELKKECSKYLSSVHDDLNLELDKCHQKIIEIDKKIRNYQLDVNNLFKTKASQDVFYTNCKNLNGKSIADRIFTSNELPLIKGIILENKNLWDPGFVDSEGNTLLHKLAQMVERDNTLTDYIQPLIDQGFSLTRKNSEGKSAKDIFVDVFSKIDNKKAIYLFTETAKAEEQINGSLKKELDSLLESGSVDNLAKIVHSDEKGCKKYYGTLFNPFHSVVSSCFNGDLSNDYLFKKKLSCFKKLLESNDLRSALDKTDEKRCNFLHRAIEEATVNYSGSDANKMLEHILLDVARGLNGNRNLKLCNELFFKQRNSNGDNVVEALSKVEDSLNIFKKLEKEFGKNTFTDECDLNLILVNAVNSKNSDLFEHVIEKYALNRFRTPSEDGQPPLHAAVMSGDQKAVLAVLKSGANINQINSNGRTAAHELLIFLRDNPDSQKHIDLVNYLTSHGAFLGPYQEENKERGEISEVIESMEGEIKENVLFTIARGRSDFYDMKHKLLNEASNFIRLKNKDSPLKLDLDISGSVVFFKINNGTFKSSQFLNSDVCKSNHLTTSYFDIDGCKGYVQKSAGGKRNYVIFEDGISEGNSGKIHHPTKIKVWLSKENSITVLVSADGTVEPAETSHKIMGVEIKDNLSEYETRRGEFKKDHEKYKRYIEKLWKKIDSQGEYKNEVYIGGIPLKEALMRGRWRDRSVQKEKQTQNKEQERIQKSPEPNYSRRNSKGDEIGETIEDAQMEQSNVNQQLQSKSNNATTADADSNMSPKKSSTGVVGSEQGKSTRLGVKNNQSISRLGMNDDIKNLNELEQKLAQPNKGLKSVPPQEQHSDSDKLISELEQRLAQPNKGLKSVPPQEQHSDSDKLASELEQRLAQPNKGLKKLNPREYYISPETKERLGDLLGSEIDDQYLENNVSSKINLQISNSQEVKNIQSQQVEKLNDEKRKNFYEAIEGVAETLKDTMSVVEKGQILNKLRSENFYKDVSQAVKGIEKGLEDIVEESIQALTSSNQEVKNAQPQQVEKLNDERKKNFYKAVKEVAETLKNTMDVVEESQISNSKEQKSEKELKNATKKMELNLNPINHNGNVSPNTPDSGYVSTASSPSQEEKGTWDSYESEKPKINVKHAQSSSEKYIIKDNGIKLDDIEFEIGEKEKGAKDSCKSEKQKNNLLLGKSEACNIAEFIKTIQEAKAKEKFSKLDTNYKNGQDLRAGNKPLLPPILSSSSSKPGRVR
ncbi:MAG: ankyrin repeat domain-containing protein [Wolbachia endosymbiont of Xenopsylla cheopis]